MKNLPKIIFFFLLFTKILTLIKDESTIDIRKYKLNQYMKQYFSMDEEKNPFLKALNEYGDHKATVLEIEQIFGHNYAIVKQQFEQSRKFACGLVIAEMKMYEKNVPYENKKLKMIFSDFYDFMNFGLDPDTLSLNKDSYVILKNLPENAFADIFSNLSELYKKYIPLNKHIEFIKIIYLKRIHDMVKIKCPLFRNEEIENMTDDKEEMKDNINAAHNEEKLIGDKAAVIDRDQLFKVKSLFKMMNQKNPQLEAGVYLKIVFGFLVLLF